MKTIDMIRKILALTAIVLLILPGIGDAGNRSGTVTGQFLKLPLNARAVGMGGAQVALANGVTSIGYNPAGLNTVQRYGFGATYSSWFADIQYSYAGVATRLEGIGIIGASVTMLSSDEMIETTPAYPEGTGRTFRSGEYAFSVAIARQVTDLFVVGVNAKIITSNLANLAETDLGASTFAFDVGTLYDVPTLNTRIGVSLTNIGKDLVYITETYSLPTALRFGVLVDIIKEENHSMVSTLQVTRLNDAEEQYNFGAEYVLNDMFALRGGWKFAYDQENVTGGFGMKLGTFGIDGAVDYGYNNFTYLPGTHTFTLELMF